MTEPTIGQADKMNMGGQGSYAEVHSLMQKNEKEAGRKN